jgi:hypothetical protein
MDIHDYGELKTLLTEVVGELGIVDLLTEIRDLLSNKKPEVQQEQTIDISVLRKMAQNLLMEGKEPEIKKLFAEYGVKKLSELDPSKYDEIKERLAQWY